MISVIIPTYNRAQTIKRAVTSVLNQSYKDLELIVVDDNSADDTEKILNEIKDKRLKYFKLDKNSGACVARNLGIMMASGDYIAFQDSDDYWMDNKLELQLKYLKEKNADLCFCSIEVCDGGKKCTIRPNKKEIKKCNKKGVLSALCDGNFISTQAIIGKATCFKDNVRFDESLPRLQDFDICLRLSKKYRWCFCDKVLAKLYVQSDSVSRSNDKMIKAANIIMEKDYEFGQEDNRRLKSHLYEDIGNTYLAMGDTKNAKLYYSKSSKEKFRVKLLCKEYLAKMRGRK